MKLVKTLLLLLIISVSAYYLATHLYYYPCAQPVIYRLGTIDPRFNLDNDAAYTNMRAAAALWNTAAAKTLFEADPGSRLTINFVYDARQGLASRINSAENKTSADKAALDKRIADFNAKAADFKKRVQDLNAQIDYWNSRGGAPPDVYNQIQSQSRDLEAEGRQLQSEAASLNQSAANFNSNVQDLNASIDSLNSLLAQKPEEGIYDSGRQVIEIYFVNTKAELIHTLAHEFGHALNIGHVSDPKAIMYAYTSQSTKLAPDDTSALTAACQKINRLAYLFGLLKTSLTPANSSSDSLSPSSQ